MKRCPTCNRTYADLSLNFCLDDGTPLTSDAATTPDLNATIRYPAPRDTSEPPPTEIYRPAPTAATSPPRPSPPPPPPPPQPQPQQQWSPTPAPAAKKSNAIWWILGVFAVLVVIGAGLVVMLLVFASMGSNSNVRISNVNTSNSNVSANTNVNANTNLNANVSPPTSLADDFSQAKWGTGTSQFGRSWYANDEYHMSSKEQTFVVMYAPSNDYSTENATVKVTARSVTGNVPSAGFGLMVHCLQSRSGKLEDYAILIFPSDEPEYEIIMHKGGEQQTVVERTKSDAIKSGSAPNELSVKIKGTTMIFSANGQVLKQVTDKENYRKGRVGFYTSDVFEVAFDDLSIERTP
ncbi:MAG TPA: hypothetical protein VFR51_18610 [Pyrinomonadaceae bacterium]|nr:hypothetical protein [Pyrinomonadaceae bacterium]